MIWQLALIGLLGGLITGVSPCILPVLPVIFFSGGVQSARNAGEQDTVDKKARRKASRRPYLVILGLALSFSVFTLLGSLLLTLLNLPQDLLRWIGLVVLTALGLALIFPSLERLMEKSFAWIPQKQVGGQQGGFLLGAALGLVYVPCAGPVLAAISVAGATGRIGVETLVLTICFAVGAALPLLFFALGGRKIAERIAGFRKHQRGLKVVSGLVMIALAIGLVFNLPQALQRLIPDYTAGLQDTVNNSDPLKKLQLGGIITDENKDLDKCSDGASALESCGKAPSLTGIQQWFNTGDNKPIAINDLQGKVVLVDFWAYSCINCQRSIPHMVKLYDAYKDYGLVVIGVHSPEYAFEKVPSNVEAAAKELNITYPVAIDNNLSTWTNYRNRYWPANYLVDSMGNVRGIKFGEGGYQTTEAKVRELLKAANPQIQLPPPVETNNDVGADTDTTQETYLGGNKASNYGGGDNPYSTGEKTFTLPTSQPDDTFALSGAWKVDSQSITPQGAAAIRLRFHAQKVFIVVSGEGELTTVFNGETKKIKVSGVPTLYQIVDQQNNARGNVSVELPSGVNAYSFTFG